MKNSVKCWGSALSAVLLLGFNCSVVHAGWLDNINNAAKNIKNASQSGSSSGGGGSLSAGLGATSFEALGEHNKCFDKLKGYRMKLLADKMEEKFKATSGLSDAERKTWQEDIDSVRAAQKSGAETPAPVDPKNPIRYDDRLTRDEKMQVQSAFGAYYNSIVSECQGRDHMNAGHTTKMNYIQDTTAADAQQAKSDQKMQGMMDCLNQIKGLRWRMMAEKMQAKMDALNPSGQERKEWEEDLAVVKSAESGSVMMPQSPDVKNPMRFMMRLNTQEQMDMNQALMTQTQELSQKCSSASSSPVEREITKGGLVDRSKSPANKNATQTKDKEYADLNKGRGGSTNLLALRRDNGCFDQIKGHMAKVTADKLESKLKSAGNISAQKRKEWEEDIAAWRQAEKEGRDAATPVDPNNPYRWYDYVTNQERAEINKIHADFNNKIIKECNARPSGL